MARNITNEYIQAFNRGLVSPLILGRLDIDRIAVSAEVMTNVVAREVGSMQLRPGTQYLGSSRNNLPAKYIPFVRSLINKALIEVTDESVRVWVDDRVVVRPAVTANILNGDFNNGLTAWSVANEPGTLTFGVDNALHQTGGGGTSSTVSRLVSIGGLSGVVHALKVVVLQGEVQFKVGSTAGEGDYIEAILTEGDHSLAFTPAVNFHIEMSNMSLRTTIVDECTIEPAGDMVIPSPWRTVDLRNIRSASSADVTWVACEGYQGYRIERTGDESWSVVKYLSDNGPMRLPNVSPTTLQVAGLFGSNRPIFSSQPLFREGHVGAIFRITSSGQRVTAVINSDNEFTDTIRVSGVGTGRAFTINRTLSVFVGTLTLQSSIASEFGPFQDTDTPGINLGATGSGSFNDGLDNQIIWYRIGSKAGEFTSGIASVRLDYSVGFIDGFVRVTAVVSEVEAKVDVLSPLGGIEATDDWAEGVWSDFRGQPTAVDLVEGRLSWAGQDRFIASESDNFNSFDESIEGDSAPISKIIGSGPVEVVNWILSTQHLLLGADLSEFSLKSSSFDEPLSNTNSSIKVVATNGTAKVAAIRIDRRAIYVQRGGIRLYELAIGGGLDYVPVDLTALNPNIGSPGINHIAVQRQRDTRIHCIRANGSPAILVSNPHEEVNCWKEYITDGEVEDVVVLPGDPGDNEDIVYYHVKRIIDGQEVRYLERWAFEDQCQGGPINRQADSFVVYDGAPTSIAFGLEHLEGKDVVIWGDGKDLGMAVVSGGQIVLPEPISQYCIGLGYKGQWMSTKLGRSFSKSKRISHVGLLLYNTHCQGIKYGPSFDKLDNLPLTRNGATIPEDTVFTDYDEQRLVFPGGWSADSRICLEMQAPRPCTALGLNFSLESHDRT